MAEMVRGIHYTVILWYYMFMTQPKIADILKSYFSEMKNIDAVILFGSAAEDRLTDSSDIDIAVCGAVPLSFDELLDINTDLQILFRRNIDLIDLNQASGLIHYKILTKGLRILGSSRTLTDHFIKALDFRTDFMPQLNEMQKKRIEKTAYGNRNHI